MNHETSPKRKTRPVTLAWLWFQIFLSFTSAYGNDPIWLAHIFQMGGSALALDHWTLHGLRAIGLRLKEMGLALAERMEGLQLHRDVFTYSALISACVPWLATCSSRGPPRWWFPIFFYVHPYLGKIPILTNIFQMGWNHHLAIRGPPCWNYLGKIPILTNIFQMGWNHHLAIRGPPCWKVVWCFCLEIHLRHMLCTFIRPVGVEFSKNLPEN